MRLSEWKQSHFVLSQFNATSSVASSRSSELASCGLVGFPWATCPGAAYLGWGRGKVGLAISYRPKSLT